MMMMTCWRPRALLLTLVCCSAAAAAPDTASFYSHTLPVQFQGSGALVQLRLPKDVYLHAHSSTLDDLRLFDAHGRPVPFALTLPLGQRGATVRSTPAKLFALDTEEGASGARLAIRTAPDGSLLSVESQPGKATAAGALAGVLIDLGQAAPEGKVSALVFTAPPGVDNYSAGVVIESSDDLQTWHWLADAPLDWLSNGAKDTLANNRIAFDARAMRYVRLRWRDGKPRMFGAVVAEREQAGTLAYAPDTLLIAPQPGEFAGDLAYPVGRAVPLRNIAMPLTETGTVIPSEVGYYVELPAIRGAAAPRTAARWQFTPLLRTTFYRIAQKDGSVRTPPDLMVAPTSVDRLVVRPLTPLTSTPSLRIGWLPATMIFAAREAGPYTLAVGRDQAPGTQAALSDVAPGYRAPELLGLATAHAGPAVQQRGAAPDRSAAERAGWSATARTAVLWGVLLLGVLVLAVLCWRMVRQMRAGETP
ncbi:MAG: DUF3999 domain-containing protein [Pseudomonadota bacterium]|nr:DUF3999 domain-containing protein [Pseudomonadota bacterium]